MDDAEKTAFEQGRMRGRTEGMRAAAIVLSAVGGIALGISAISNACETGRTAEKEAQQAEGRRNAELLSIGKKQTEQTQGREGTLKELIRKASDKKLKAGERKEALEVLSTFENKDEKEKEAIRSLMEKMALDPNRTVNKEAMDYVFCCVEPRRALNVFLTAINQLDAESAFEAALDIGIMTSQGKGPSSKEELRQGLERIIRAQGRFQFSKDRMAPGCRYKLKDIKLEWNNMLWKQNAANKSSSLMRPPKTMRNSTVLPREVKPLDRNYATRRMG